MGGGHAVAFAVHFCRVTVVMSVLTFYLLLAYMGLFSRILL